MAESNDNDQRVLKYIDGLAAIIFSQRPAAELAKELDYSVEQIERIRRSRASPTLDRVSMDLDSPTESDPHDWTPPKHTRREAPLQLMESATFGYVNRTRARYAEPGIFAAAQEKPRQENESDIPAEAPSEDSAYLDRAHAAARKMALEHGAKFEPMVRAAYSQFIEVSNYEPVNQIPAVTSIPSSLHGRRGKTFRLAASLFFLPKFRADCASGRLKADTLFEMTPWTADGYEFDIPNAQLPDFPEKYTRDTSTVFWHITPWFVSDQGRQGGKLQCARYRIVFAILGSTPEFELGLHPHLAGQVWADAIEPANELAGVVVNAKSWDYFECQTKCRIDPSKRGVFCEKCHGAATLSNVLRFPGAVTFRYDQLAPEHVVYMKREEKVFEEPELQTVD